MAIASPQVPDPFADAIAGLCLWVDAPFFVQIGATAVAAADRLYHEIGARGLRGLIADPLPDVMTALQQRYRDQPGVKPLCLAVTGADSGRPLQRFRAEMVQSGLLPPSMATIASLAMDELLADDGAIGRLCAEGAVREMLRGLTEPVPAERIALGDLLEAQQVERIDMLLVDADGHELAILRSFDFRRWRPALLRVDHRLLGAAARVETCNLLTEQGYVLNIRDDAILAMLDPDRRLRADVRGLSQLADRLLGDRRLEEAAALLEQLCAIAPEDGQVQQRRFQAAIARDDLPTALIAMLALRGSGPLAPGHAGIISQLAGMVSLRFNELLAQNRMAEAACLITPAADLMPDRFAIVYPAMRVNWDLNNLPEAQRLARLVIRLEPTHEKTNLLLYVLANEAQDLVEARHCLEALVSVEDSEFELHVRLFQVLTLASLILCQDRVGEGDMAKARALADRAEGLARKAAHDRGEDAVWHTHFLMSMRGVAVADRLPPLPGGRAVPPTRYATAAGMPLCLDQIRERAARLGVEAVLLVAAEEVYFRRYARMFILSALCCADVPCLVVVHVIGGDGKLEQLARHIGFDHDQVVLTADAFDAASVTSECVAEPKLMPITKPIAHFQSVRFQVAEHFLAQLDLPLFAADIDSLVQWGLRGLLDRTSGSDIVFNRNNMALASHLTANLVLMRPTIHGRLFSGFLRHYLDMALQAPCLSRWIDQIALLMVRNHMMVHHPDAAFGYFDNNSDINNIMLLTYEPQPYRFLSLYQSFDLSSLRPLLRQWESELSLPPGPLPDDEAGEAGP